jgi:hypothetical protein
VHKFNDTFAIATLTALIALAILLIIMVSYLIYLRLKGECIHCRDLQQQLAKWKSGDLKRITPQMVWQREALNKKTSCSNPFTDVDTEMGVVGRGMSRAPTVASLEADKKPSLYQKVKDKMSRRGKSPTRTPDFPSHDIDRFSYYSPPQPPQAGSDGNNLYANRYSAYPSSSIYSQAMNIGRTDANGARVFSEVETSDIADMRGPLRQEADEPNRYTAYAPTAHDPYNRLDPQQKERNIATAMAQIESKEYKNAEAVLKRISATDEETHRALSIINLRDQQLNVARHPSMYTEVGLPLDQPPEDEVPARPESYQVLDWREKGMRPPELEDVEEDFSPYLNNELKNKRKSM